MSAVITRVFMNGNSQAVRIPQEFRLDTSRVEIRRDEHGDLVIHAVAADRARAVLDALSGFDDELVTLLEEDRAGQPAAQDREGL
ncbi:MAG TPA: AbrB/MazE/SpoVT family DNA-binding domain-containing protein [Burkholderiaceae bacterium]|nr:AbrB/MazE/SpoVT family DNA-binding domain-containing protein [Burkholderiaceae bacterium]